MAGRRLIVQQFGVSLDGFSTTEDNEGWHRWGSLADPELDVEVVAGVRAAGTHLLGTQTYYGHAAYWPQALTDDDPSEREIAEILRDADKVVLSHTVTGPTWAGTRVLAGDTAEEIARLKAEPGGEILAVGGVRLLRSLVALGLYDAIRLFVLPYVAGGGGDSIFSDLDRPVDLRLASSRTFPSGVCELVYER